MLVLEFITTVFGFVFLCAALFSAALAAFGYKRRNGDCFWIGLFLLSISLPGFVLGLYDERNKRDFEEHRRPVLARILKQKFDRTCTVNGTVLPYSDALINCYQDGKYRVWYERDGHDVNYFVASIQDADKVSIDLIFDREGLVENRNSVVEFEREGLSWDDLRGAFLKAQ